MSEKTFKIGDCVCLKNQPMGPAMTVIAITPADYPGYKVSTVWWDEKARNMQGTELPLEAFEDCL